jgi:hypothetical protein
MLALRAELRQRAPFIVENGAAVLMPEAISPTPPEGCELRGRLLAAQLCAAPLDRWWAHPGSTARHVFPGLSGFRQRR